MRYILAFILSVSAFFAQAQQVNPVTDYTFANRMSSGRSTVTDTAAYFSIGPRYGAVRGMMPPMVTDTTAMSANKRNGLLIFSIQKNKYQVWDSAGAKWADITGAAGSAIISADTADMLLPYLRKADTTAMLSPYLRGSGTANYLPIFDATRSVINSKVYQSGTNLLFNTTTASFTSTGISTIEANNTSASVFALKVLDTTRSYIASNSANTMDINNLRAGDIRFYTNAQLRGRFQTDGTFRLNSLTGTGSRIVTADADGVLSATSSATGLVDTTVLSTRDWRQKGDDSLGAIIATKGSGTVTSVATGYGLSGGTITTTGTIVVDSALVASRLRVGKVVDSLALVKQNVLTNPVTGTGTTNYVPKFTGTSTIGNSIIYDDGTNVGIGTASMSQKLDVSGNIRSTGQFIADNPTIALLSLRLSGVSIGRLDVFNNDVRLINFHPSSTTIISGNGDINLTTAGGSNMLFGTSNVERMRINSSGELLLNTTTDAGDYKLQVSGNAYVNGEATLTGTLYTRPGTAVGIQMVNTSAIRNSGTQYHDFGTGGSGDLYIRGGSSFGSYLTILNGGNVGIGTASPGVRFDIGATANQVFGIKTNTSNYLYAGTFNDFAILGVNRNPSTGAFSDANKAAADIAIEGASGNANIRFETSASNGSTPTERLRVHANGGLKFVGQSAAPTAEAGTVYYDTDDNKLKVYNGTTWVDLH